MKVGIMLPVGQFGGDDRMPGWGEVRDCALVADAEGLDSVWVADHFLSGRGDEEPRGVHESWSLLSGLAAITSRVELGTLVLCSSFRGPGLVAKMATTADVVSGGRLILGIGAGWYDREYEAFGYPTDHRVSRFAEALEIVRRLLAGDRVTFEGRYHAVRDAVLLPPPARRIPILVAAHRPRMMRLTARFADVWATAWFAEPDERLHDALREWDAACADEGRDPVSVARALGVLASDPDRIDELAARLRAFAEMGFDHAVVLLEPTTVRSIERLAEAARAIRSG
jgi:probable F420-dependent oxidoreductase